MSDAKKIVAIDDCGIVLKSLESILQKTYSFKGFTKGDYALKYLKEKSADLIILDIDMPDISGYELLAKIKNIGRMENVPILFLTSNADKEHVVKAMQAGGDDYAVKPIDEEIIMNKLKKLL